MSLRNVLISANHTSEN